jgi:quinol monooxygenase YgiN
VNLKDENELTFIEEWADMAAVDAHNASAHFTTLVPKLNECISDSDVALYKNL